MAAACGCASQRVARVEANCKSIRPSADAVDPPASFVAYQTESAEEVSGNESHILPLQPLPAAIEVASASLPSLEVFAQSMNPRLLRLSQEAAAAEAKTHYVDKLPDPTVGTNIFASPIETAAGAQRANVSVRQMIPWLKRLDAQSQQAFFEAMALQQVYEAERLKVVGDVRALWYRLYVLGKQLETSRSNLEVLRPLVGIASDRVATGRGTARDAWLGNLELSKLEEQILTFNQQIVSAKAELNRVIGRDPDHPIEVPQTLKPLFPDWTHAMLRQVAWEQQPEIAAAELHAQATSWGLEVARLKRRPELSLSASWYAIDDNRPMPSLVDVGLDAWSIGAQVSVPLSHHKYDAIEEEAMWRHSAAHASVDDVLQRYDSLLRDLRERAKTAAETAALYEQTLLLNARPALDADVDSYSNGSVDLDSIVRDFRTVLMLELGYHRAIGELAVALARIQQAVGTDLATTQSEASPLFQSDEPQN
jgi:outer membrane protein TolC